MGPLGALRALLQGFGSTPATSMKAMRQLMECSPDLFLHCSLALAGETFSKTTMRAWATLLSTRTELAALLSDPMESALAPAIELARMVASTDATFEVKLMKHVQEVGLEHRGAVAYRVLELIEHISDGSRVLPLLMHLASDPDRWIRSKVALLMGRWRHAPKLISRCLSDPDPRVRANAVESLWGVRDPEVCERFRAALQDYNHRVSANAVVGLHLASAEPAKPLLESMITHPDQLFQAAGAWATGRCREASLRQSLVRLASGLGPQRRTAIRALVELRAAADPALAEHTQVHSFHAAHGSSSTR